jgi:hypothetical protein
VTLAAIQTAIAARLLALLDRAGSSSRAVALAVALDRLGVLNPAVQRLAAEVGDHGPQLDDLNGALVRWRFVEPFTASDLIALDYAACLIRCRGLEIDLTNITAAEREA